jgi:hypothetical protein
VNISLEYGASNPVSHNNLALEYGFDPSVVVWSDDEHVRAELRRLLSHAHGDKNVGGKSLANLDLRGEEPYDLSTARFEEVDMLDLKLPKGTNLSNAHFIGCNVLDVNFNDCVME